MGSLSLGCLLPPPIESESELGNTSPMVAPSTIFPEPDNMPVLLSTQCREPELFNLAVFDADGDDTIYWRVFIDFSSNRLQFEQFEDRINQEPVLPSSVDISGQRTLRFFIDASDPRFLEQPNRFEIPHIIEVIASDRPFNDDPFEARQPDPAVAEVAETTIWAWTVTITDGPCVVGAN